MTTTLVQYRVTALISKTHIRQIPTQIHVRSCIDARSKMAILDIVINDDSANPAERTASDDVTTDDYLQPTCCATYVVRAANDDVTGDEYLQPTCCVTSVVRAVNDDVTGDEYLQPTCCATSVVRAANDDVTADEHQHPTCCGAPPVTGVASDYVTGAVSTVYMPFVCF